MQEILSPITKSNNISFVRKISVKEIIKSYKKFNIDTRQYFLNFKYITVYKCNDTDYKFYYPFTISGDSSFYEHFQTFDWYYMPWKWEHEITTQYLRSGMKVLEVGCAHGAFLKKISESFDLTRALGLEINETSAVYGDKWEIKNQTIKGFSESNKNAFDLVCSFQVLEHIYEVKSFIQAKIDCLKKGGILIISVPNNDSFIKDVNNCLNMPPHHMGLWDEKSLKALQKYFPLKLLNIHFEELQDYHIDFYLNSIYYSNFTKYFGKTLKKFNKISGKYKSQIEKIKLNRKNITGHSVLIAFKKL